MNEAKAKAAEDTNINNDEKVLISMQPIVKRSGLFDWATWTLVNMRKSDYCTSYQGYQGYEKMSFIIIISK